MILAIDCGSTNHKVALFDERLRRLADAARPVVYTVRTAERVEFDPEKIWRDTMELIRQVCQIAGITPRQIKTIALTSQANTFTLLNPANTAVTPFVSWLDKRATAESAELHRSLGKDFHQHCSFPQPSPQLQISKLLWQRNQLPAAVRAGTRVMSLPSFLGWRLAGIHCTDANLAAMSGLYSLQEQHWWADALVAVSCTPAELGQVTAPGEATAVACQCIELNLPPELKIVFAGNDQTAGAFANNIRDGGLVLTLGTALVAYRFAGEQPGPYPAAGWWGLFPGGGFYELMACNEGCAALDWAVEQMLPGNEAEFFRLATTAPLGNATFFPQLMHTKRAWSGGTDMAAKARAVLEGISFTLRELVEGMDTNRGAKEPVSVIGGGSANPFWLVMVANVLNRPVRCGYGDNLLGAAMMAQPNVQPPASEANEIFAPDEKLVAEYEIAFRKWREASPDRNPLPYTDAKPVGAADFYFAINATFRFIEAKLGRYGLRAYWTELGKKYYSPVSASWQRGGLPAVSEYWRAFFNAEPGAEVEIQHTTESVTLNVRICPALKHLRAGGRQIVSCFCEHCYFTSEAMAEPAGLTVRIEGGNGSCRQTFLPHKAAVAAQDFTKIKEVA